MVVKIDKLYLDSPAPHPMNPVLTSSLDCWLPSSQPQTPTHESIIPQASMFGPHLMVLGGVMREGDESLPALTTVKGNRLS